MNWPEELAKLLPVEKVYEDVAQPAAKELGKALEAATKAARWLIAPLDYLAAQHGRYLRYLARVGEKVPEDRRIQAYPQIVGPALDGLRYVPEESVIAEMFVNLLARAMDKERVNEAHPAFPQIIAQLSPDEAVVIYHLSRKSYVYRTFSRWDFVVHAYAPRQVLDNEFPTNLLSFPANYSMYMDHLESLNLAGSLQQGTDESVMEEVEGKRRQIGVNKKNQAHLTPFGQLFTKACVPEQLPESGT